jgi:hypothetical protein
MVGYAGVTDRPQEDRLVLPEPLQTVLGHHVPGLEVALATPVELAPPKAEAPDLARPF